jgi:hypothetical protein
MNKIKEKIYTTFKMRGKTLSFFGQNQYADWKILLSILFAGFFISVIVCFFSFLNISKDVDIYSSGPVVLNKKINKGNLMKVINKMEDRQKNFEELKVNKPTVGDPGI